MKIETFEVQDILREPPEASEEACRIIAELGLEGQAGLLKPDAGKQEAWPPYRKMLAEEFFAYSVLCPDKMDACKYNSSPIPLRVLQVMAHAKGLFKHLEVWDHVNADVKDPVLVGSREHPQYSWQREYFLLARWGDELDSFPILLERACKVIRNRAEGALRNVERSITSHIALVQGMSSEELIKKGAGWEPEVKL